jgi:hypothetical protein
VARSIGVSAFLPMFRPSTPALSLVEARRLHIGDERVDAAVVEAHAVDDAVRRRQAEHARLGLPGCARGVTVPTSIEPKPRSASASM